MYRGFGGTFQECTITLVQGSHGLLLMGTILHDRKSTALLSSERLGHAHSVGAQGNVGVCSSSIELGFQYSRLHRTPLGGPH